MKKVLLSIVAFTLIFNTISAEETEVLEVNEEATTIVEESINNEVEVVNNETTKEIILAHISQEANHPQLALDVLEDAFRKQGFTHAGMRLRAAHQFDVCTIQEVLY